jgi:hypothetical protein
MDFVQHTNCSEWDHAYTNVQVSGRDVNFALVIAGLFVLIALIV